MSCRCCKINEPLSFATAFVIIIRFVFGWEWDCCRWFWFLISSDTKTKHWNVATMRDYYSTMAKHKCINIRNPHACIYILHHTNMYLYAVNTKTMRSWFCNLFTLSTQNNSVSYFGWMHCKHKQIIIVWNTKQYAV